MGGIIVAKIDKETKQFKYYRLLKNNIICVSSHKLLKMYEKIFFINKVFCKL